MGNLFQNFKMPWTSRLMEALPPTGNVPAAPAPIGAGPNPAAAEPTTDPAVDNDDNIPNIDHPANNPAVHASHAGFLVAHNALADDPTPEAWKIANDQWTQLGNALNTYVFGGGGGEEAPPGDPSMAPEGEEDGQEPDEEMTEPGEEAPEAEGEGEEAPEEDEEEAGPPKKKNPFQKSESFREGAAIRTNAQMRGVNGMNSVDYQKVTIEYDSAEDTPWHIACGDQKLSVGFETRDQAENAFSDWMAQSQEPLEMDGKEDDYTKALLPTPPSDTDVSAGSVMGGQKQNFTPPRIGGGNFKESSHPPSLLDLINGSRENNAAERRTESLYASGPQGQTNPYANLRETACPLCCGQGCQACEHEGAVSYQEAAAMEDAVEQYGRENGTNLTWFGAIPKTPWTGNHKPGVCKHPMAKAYDQINAARSRR